MRQYKMPSRSFVREGIFLPYMRGFSTPVEFGEMLLAITRHADQPHRAANDVLCGIGTAECASVDEETVERL